MSAASPAISDAVRRLVPYLLLPLSLIACALASSPWLRAFPSSVLSVPLFGAALLSVVLPVVVIGIGIRKLWLTALIDVAGFVFFVMLVALRAPAGFGDLVTGLVHGPSQILTFALPLVSPRTLLVAPVALCWLCGAVIGECIGRGWQSVLPYASVLVTFGLSYAATARAVTSSSDGQRYDTILAGALLLTLLLLRAAQAWVEQDAGAETTQPEGILPLRGLAIGTLLAVVIALVAAAVVQSSAFSGPPTTPARVPPLDQSTPLTPVSFVSGLRPADPRSNGTALFNVSVDRQTSNYIAIADVDFYDGDGWSFNRTFRPSGGVIPADNDPAVRAPGPPVSQQYTIAKGPMTSVPWMPFMYRPQKITGTAVNIDPQSGMVVPSRPLGAGARYSVRSAATPISFDKLPKTALLGTSAPPSDTLVPNAVGQSLGAVVTSLENETNTKSAPAVPFLQALMQDLRTSYALSGGPSAAASTPGASPSPRPGSPVPSSGPPSAGGTSFAGVLASILGSTRSATPEQYATLVALVAREIGVPARVVTGFRLPPEGSGSTIPAGTHTVTTADAWTWVEIPIRGRGWVVLDAAPGRYSGQKPPSSAAPPSTLPPPPTPTQNALITTSNPNSHAVAPPSKVPTSDRVSATTLAIVLIGLAILIVLLLVVLVLRKRVRARLRRRPGDPRRRLLGAWQESLDVLVESGLPDLTYLTSAEVAARTKERFGGETAAQALYIGDSANAAIFSPTSWVGAAEADAAWRAQTVLRKSVRRRLSLRERAGAGLRYHRTTRVLPVVGPSSWAAAAKARATATSTRGRHSTRRRRRVH
ncbi:MAG: Transglutaminase-like superfamily protein [Jatrophihabitans sp.]|nr:Transglutaminase-like superfamily protein [Jatrophihabitans sp.]